MWRARVSSIPKTNPSDPAIRGHYAAEGLAAPLLAALDDPALEVGPALDQFHIGGAKATERLVARVDFPIGARVLDVGAGLGGPARLLAAARQWDVTGIDLSPTFCRIATVLSEKVGRGGTTRFCAGDALHLPFADDGFDVIWTEHIAMNIAARDSLYAELARVTRPGGVLAIFDVVAGTNKALLNYPVPWARDPAQSHLVTPDALKAAVTKAGWVEQVWSDETAFARDWLAKARPPKGASGPSLRQVMGKDFPVMLANLRDNFADGWLGAIQAVFAKPA